MIEDRPELWDTPIEQLELWKEANVRKTDVLLNIEELAGNIKRYGVQVPLLVKVVERNKKYLVFSGQRRLKACEIAGVSLIPCFVFKNITLIEAKILSFSENLYRESMTMDDKSLAASELFKKFKNMGKVARALGVKDVKTVRRYLKYDDIPEEVRKFGKKAHGNLSAQEIEDIHFIFPDRDRAVASAKKLATLRKGTLSRRKFHESIRQSHSSDDVHTISKRADKLIHMQTFTIVLPDSRSKTLEKVAHARRMKIEDFLVNIVEQWIDSYLSGKNR